MDYSFFAKRAKQILENCPACNANDELGAIFNDGSNTDYSEDKRREAIIKAMLLIKEFHGTNSPLYRLLDDQFNSVAKCPVEQALGLFLDHLHTFSPAPKRNELK